MFFVQHFCSAPGTKCSESDGPWWCMIIGQCYVADPNNVYALDTSCEFAHKGPLFRWRNMKQLIDDSYSTIMFFVCLLLFLLSSISRWWFQLCFIFTPILVEMIQFDKYVSIGLKPPPGCETNDMRNQKNSLTETNYSEVFSGAPHFSSDQCTLFFFAVYRGWNTIQLHWDFISQ